MRKKQLLFSKREVNITFGTYYNQLKYIVFITSRSLSNGKYSHHVERIDISSHRNPDYNIKISKTIINKSLEIC
jgi:hypothetical protein